MSAIRNFKLNPMSNVWHTRRNFYSLLFLGAIFFLSSTIGTQQHGQNEKGFFTMINKVQPQPFDQSSELCNALVTNPFPYNKTCNRDWRSMTCRNGNKFQMFSQFGQDYYLYKHHFQFLKRRGVYLDIAANDAIVISNTYFFDKCLKWKGVCVEANDEYHFRLHSERSCHIVPTCVSDEHGKVVEFLPNGGGGGVVGSDYKSLKKFASSLSRTTRKICTTVEKILSREELKVIDYFSLDVEGHELKVLQGIDFFKTQIKVMTVELNGGETSGISKFLKEKGYDLLQVQPDFGLEVINGLLREDAVFIHNSTTFGNPE